MKGKKTGGRVKGTPNKATAFSKSIIIDILSRYTDINEKKNLEKDIEDLDAKDRIDIMIKLMAFVTPKPQSVDMSITTGTSNTIEDKLRQLSDENEE